MGATGGIGVMNEKNRFTLVPRPPGTLEKAEPGAKRILSGMVADTLALVKKESPHRNRPLRIVMLDDEPCVLDALKIMMQFVFNDTKILTCTDGKEALQELAQEAPDLFTTDWAHPTFPGEALLRVLAEKKVKYPIFVISARAEYIEANDLLGGYLDQGLNVSLLSKPFTLEQLRSLLLKHLDPSDNLKIPRVAIEKSKKITPQPRHKRTPRIVVVDDDDDWLKLMESFIQVWLKDATVLLFQNGHAAWQELLRADPDLLITDIGRPIFTAEDMLPLLAKRNVKYPILIVSGHHDKKVHRQLRESAGPHLNLTFLTKPVVPEELEKCILTLLATFMATANEK
jgi:DNA-binding NtrC family response regulator